MPLTDNDYPTAKDEVHAAIQTNSVQDRVLKLCAALEAENLYLKSFTVARAAKPHTPDGYVGALWGVEVIAVDG